MSQSTFISYSHSDSDWLRKIKRWERNGLLPSHIRITHERADYRQEGRGAIRREVQSMIQGAATVLVVVGDNSHDRHWVDQEVAYAKTRNKRILVGRIPDTRGAAPREVRNIREVLLDPGVLRNEL